MILVGKSRGGGQGLASHLLKDGKDHVKVYERRRVEETHIRQERINKGWRGLWDRIRGHHSKTKARNEREAIESLSRDQVEKDELIFSHLSQRQAIKRDYQHQLEKIRDRK